MKNKKLKNIPKYSFGANAIQNWGYMDGVEKANTITQSIGAAGSMLSSATSGKAPTLGGVFSGTATGAATGAMIGGVPGAIIGGGLGLISSVMGSGGSVNEQTGEYEDPSGIAGLFGHSKTYIRNKAAKIRDGIRNRENAEQLAANYYQNNGYNEVALADGGVVPTTKAYLDDGEMLRLPDGTIGQIPEENKPTDSNLLNVPVGTQVLSDKLKVPGTNKTFAEMGKKLMKKSNKKPTDIYAENSQRLNDINNQIAYQQLLEQQEALKNKNGKNKNGIPAYDEGTAKVLADERKLYDRQTNKIITLQSLKKSTRNVVAPTGYKITDIHRTNEPGRFSLAVDMPNQNEIDVEIPLIDLPASNIPAGEEYIKGLIQPGEDRSNYTRGYDGRVYFKDWKTGKSGEYMYGTGNYDSRKTNYNAIANSRPQYYAERDLPLFEDGAAINSGLVRAGWSHGFNKDYNFDYVPDLNIQMPTTKLPIAAASKRSTKGSVIGVRANATSNQSEPVVDKMPPKVTKRNISLTDMTTKPDIMLPKVNVSTPYSYVPEREDGSSFDIYPIAATLAPLLSREKAEKVDTYTYDPVYGPTNYNIDPMLREATLSDRISRYNMANISPNTGASMAFGLQSAVNRNKAIANAYATKHNAENQMAFNNAQIANQWGQHYANARHVAATEYAQNKAKARSINRSNVATALNNIGSVLRDKKQTAMDLAAYEMLQPMLNYGTEDNVVKRINKLVNRRMKNG